MERFQMGEKHSFITRATPHVCVLGFFDGVHLGHQALIEEGKKQAVKRNLPLRVMSFAPHPSVIVQPDRAITSYLTPVEEKGRVLETLGVDQLAIVSFTREIAELEPEKFVQTFLNEQQCEHAVVGFDFAYGKKGAGKAQRLHQHGQQQFDVSIVEEKKVRRKKIGSTEIRAKLTHGDVSSVPQMMGRYYRTNVYLPALHDRKATGLIDKQYRMPKQGVYEVTLFHKETLFDATCYVTGEQTRGKHVIELLFNRTTRLPQASFQLDWITRCEEADEEEIIFNYEQIYSY